MTRTYKAAIYQDIGKVEIQEWDYPVCGDDDVIVKNLKAGICGGDIAALKIGGDANRIWKGFEFGHEMVSEVVEKGKNVRDLEVGDHVFPNMGNAHRDHNRMATVGGFSEYIFMPQCELGYSCFKIDKNLPLKTAALLEPFVVGMKGAKNTDPTPEDTALVFGAGIIGISAAIYFKYLGLEKVAIVDISDFRLANAEKFGIIPINTAKEDLKEKASEVFGTKPGMGVPAVAATCYVDALGLPVAMDGFTSIAAPGSRLAVVGVYHEPIVINNQLTLVYGNWTIKGCGAGGYDVHQAAALEVLGSGRFDFEQLVSHEYKQEDIVAALEMAGNAQQAQKVMISYTD